VLERPGFHASAGDGVSKPANYGIEVTAGRVQRVNIEAVKDTIAVRRRKAKAGVNPKPRVVHNTPARRSQGSDVATRSTGTWFVYILRCADGTLYTGVTKDLARRTQQHNVGTAARYTRSRRPVKLVY